MKEARTVEELIALLSAFDPNMPIATTLHSDYTAGVSVWEQDLYDNGGYLSRPYPPAEKVTRRYVTVA